MARNYKRDRLGRFARRSGGGGRAVRRGAGRGAGAAALGLTAVPLYSTAAGGGAVGVKGVALLAGQGVVIGGPAGALAGAAVAGAVYATRKPRARQRSRYYDQRVKTRIADNNRYVKLTGDVGSKKDVARFNAKNARLIAKRDKARAIAGAGRRLKR